MNDPTLHATIDFDSKTTKRIKGVGLCDAPLAHISQYDFNLKSVSCNTCRRVLHRDHPEIKTVHVGTTT